MQEKLRDLRDEKKLTLSELSKQVGIPTATLQRIESDEDNHASYTDIAVLAKFYNVSTDYLFGLTDNLQHRNIEIDELNISDKAIEILKSRKLNNRLVSEILSHDDFVPLLTAIESYVDRKVMPHINTVNQVYKIAEEAIKKENPQHEDDKDDILEILQQTIINEDEYLRFRISERFNELMKKLFDEHKKDALPDKEMDALKDFKDGLKTYQEEKENSNTQRAKVVLMAKQIGLNLTELTDEEIGILMKTFEKSQAMKKYRKRK